MNEITFEWMTLEFYLYYIQWVIYREGASNVAKNKIIMDAVINNCFYYSGKTIL